MQHFAPYAHCRVHNGFTATQLGQLLDQARGTDTCYFLFTTIDNFALLGYQLERDRMTILSIYADKQRRGIATQLMRNVLGDVKVNEIVCRWITPQARAFLSKFLGVCDPKPPQHWSTVRYVRHGGRFVLQGGSPFDLDSV